MLQFLNFKLEKPNDCESNFVDVFSDRTDLSSRLKNFCGSIADSVISKSNILHLRFFAETNSINSTFEALFTAFRDKPRDEGKTQFCFRYHWLAVPFGTVKITKLQFKRNFFFSSLSATHKNVNKSYKLVKLKENRSSSHIFVSRIKKKKKNFQRPFYLFIFYRFYLFIPCHFYFLHCSSVHSSFR